MCNKNQQARLSVEAQERMFRLAERDHGLSLPILKAESKIPLSTLQGWKNGATMPFWAAGALAEAGVPDYLLSLCLKPFHRYLGTDSAEEGTYHEAALETSGYSAKYLECTSPDSEAGPALSPREKAWLSECAAKAGGKLRAVAG
jgi:hypothetical protein